VHGRRRVAAAGVVTSQTPISATLVAPGSAVNLSIGQRPPARVPVTATASGQSSTVSITSYTPETCSFSTNAER
jgi:hypothetical protein